MHWLAWLRSEWRLVRDSALVHHHAHQATVHARDLVRRAHHLKQLLAYSGRNKRRDSRSRW